MAFITSATFGGLKMFRGADVLIGLDIGDGNGVQPYAAKVTDVDEYFGIGDCQVFGNTEESDIIGPEQNVEFDATADASGDPTTLSNFKWMWASHANVK